MESPICKDQSDRFWTAILVICLFLMVSAVCLGIIYMAASWVGFGSPVNAGIAMSAGTALCAAIYRAIP